MTEGWSVGLHAALTFSQVVHSNALRAPCEGCGVPGPSNRRRREWTSSITGAQSPAMLQHSIRCSPGRAEVP